MLVSIGEIKMIKKGDNDLHDKIVEPTPVEELIEVANADFIKDLGSLINRHSMETNSGTPAYILAEYLCSCLMALNQAVNMRSLWIRKTVEFTWDLDIKSSDEVIEHSCESDSVCHCEEDLLTKSPDDKLSGPMMEVC